MNRALVIALLILALPLSARADDDVVQKPITAADLTTFDAQVAKVKEEMQPGGVYEHISPTSKSKVDDGFAELRTMLSSHVGGTLSPDAKIEIFNKEEQVNALLRQNDNNRKICEHIAPIGSHIPVTKCTTYGDLMRSQRNNKDVLRELNKTYKNSEGGG